MSVCPKDVLQFTSPTKKFLCRLEDNHVGIEFLEFTIQDYDTKRVIFHVDRDSSAVPDFDTSANFDVDQLRRIDYKFESDVLMLPRVQTKLKFKVGRKKVRNFRMIERHYFRDRLIKSFDFTFPFCVPESTNTWYSEYELPPMDNALIDEIVKRPFETESDSFYFVGNELIMHNKARYHYYHTKARLAKMEAKSGGGGAAADSKTSSADSKTASASAAASASAGGKDDYDDKVDFDDKQDFSGKWKTLDFILNINLFFLLLYSLKVVGQFDRNYIFSVSIQYDNNFLTKQSNL